MQRPTARGIARFTVTPTASGFVTFRGSQRSPAAAGPVCATYLAAGWRPSRSRSPGKPLGIEIDRRAERGKPRERSVDGVRDSHAAVRDRPDRADRADPCRESPRARRPATRSAWSRRSSPARTGRRTDRPTQSDPERRSRVRSASRLPAYRPPQQRAAGASHPGPSHLDRAGGDVDDDPVVHAVKIDKVPLNPPALAVRTPRQAELVPPGPVGSSTSRDGEDDLELRVGTELVHHAHARRMRTRRGTNHHPRRKQLTRRGQPLSRPASRMRCRGGDKRGEHAEADRPDAASNAADHGESDRSLSASRVRWSPAGALRPTDDPLVLLPFLGTQISTKLAAVHRSASALSSAPSVCD